MDVLQRCYERALGILREQSELLEKCARTLLEREVLEAEQFEQLVAEVGVPK
jgi:ATP-dependent Zn protease